MWLIAFASVMPSYGFGPEAENPLTARIRDRWGVEHGFPAGPVYAISQTKDGYLWIGSGQGLVRFDGRSFRLLVHPDPVKTVRPVLGLTPDQNGDLWVRPRRPSLLRLQRGQFDKPPGSFGPPGTTVTATANTPDGSLLLWMLKGEPSAAVFRNGQFEKVSKPVGFSRSPVLALAQLSNGEIWVGTRDAGLFRVVGDNSRPVSEGLPDPKVNCLLTTRSGEIWIGTDNGLVRWNGRALTTAGIPSELRSGRILALAGDRQSNLWVGTNSRGLIRLDSRGNAWPEDAGQPADAVTALFEDREGSIWAGRASRIERIRNAPFVAIEATKHKAVNSVFSDATGAIWVAPADRGLLHVRGASTRNVSEAGLANETVHALAGTAGELWAGRQNGTITRLHIQEGTVVGTATYDRSNGLPGSAISTVHRSKDGAVWAGTFGSGAIKIDSKGVSRFTAAEGLASNVITSIAETSGRTVWFGSPRGLSAFSGKDWHTYAAATELPSANVTCLFADSDQTLWVGTVAGLARSRSGNVESLKNLLADSILGITEDRLGWLWLATSTRVLRIDRHRLTSGTARPEDFREYGRLDGLAGTERLRRHGSIVADASGRIWLASDEGVLMFDPGEAAADGAARASADIHSVVADGEPLQQGATIQVPPQRRRITIGYAGLSLTSPDRVRFRYRLDPFDQDWNDPVAAREAIYTNLSPGGYKFRVIASNPDGEWNGEEASIQIYVQPALWQTPWFRISAGVAAIGAIALLYRRRLHKLTRQLNMRFEERLDERTRIARELHDTLLQGFLSASMQLHVASDRLPEHSEVKPQVQRVLNLMGQVIEEGRNAVRGLRSFKSETLDIEEAFSTIQMELGKEEVEYRVVSSGDPKALHPILRDEVYRIGREAILNAFKHSNATKIETTIHYAPRRLRVAIRDNGSGIDAAVLKNGLEGHWGLPGMRERADRIGARLHVWSSSNTGTEVELDVPGHIAFRVSESGGPPGWLKKIYPWKGFQSGRHT
jgi:ligand-binding sensor domain-containing protein